VGRVGFAVVAQAGSPVLLAVAQAVPEAAVQAAAARPSAAERACIRVSVAVEVPASTQAVAAVETQVVAAVETQVVAAVETQAVAAVVAQACTQAVVAVCSQVEPRVWFLAAAAVVRVSAELPDASQAVVAAPPGEFLADSQGWDEFPALADSRAEPLPAVLAPAPREVSARASSDRLAAAEPQSKLSAARDSPKPIAGGSRSPHVRGLPAPAAPRCAARDMRHSPQAADAQ